jgi:hypothetical protein
MEFRDRFILREISAELIPGLFLIMFNISKVVFDLTNFSLKTSIASVEVVIGK